MVCASLTHLPSAPLLACCVAWARRWCAEWWCAERIHPLLCLPCCTPPRCWRWCRTTRPSDRWHYDDGWKSEPAHCTAALPCVTQGSIAVHPRAAQRV